MMKEIEELRDKVSTMKQDIFDIKVKIFDIDSRPAAVGSSGPSQFAKKEVKGAPETEAILELVRTRVEGEVYS